MRALGMLVLKLAGRRKSLTRAPREMDLRECRRSRLPGDGSLTNGKYLRTHLAGVPALRRGTG
jgi:hypothetical protein